MPCGESWSGAARALSVWHESIETTRAYGFWKGVLATWAFWFSVLFWMPAIFNTLEFGDFSNTKREVGGRVVDY